MIASSVGDADYSTTRRGNVAVSMGLSGCEEECSSPSSDYSDMQGDSTWGSEREEAIEISSEEPLTSSRSWEEASSKKGVDHDESSACGKGSAGGKYKCSVCGVLLMKPSLLKQHMCSHSEDVSLLCMVFLVVLGVEASTHSCSSSTCGDYFK